MNKIREPFIIIIECNRIATQQRLENKWSCIYMFNIANIEVGGVNIRTSVSHVFSGLSIDILSPIK